MEEYERAFDANSVPQAALGKVLGIKLGPAFKAGRDRPRLRSPPRTKAPMPLFRVEARDETPEVEVNVADLGFIDAVAGID